MSNQSDKKGFSRRKFFKRLGIGAGVTAGAYVVPAVIAEGFGPDSPEVGDPRHPSLYEKDVAPLPMVAILDGDLTVDAAVIGTGVTGLSAALTLKRLRPEWSVCALDSHRPCSGASTRFSTHIFGRFYAWKKVDKLGIEATRRMVGNNERVVEQLEDLLNSNDIECDLKRCDFYMTGSAEQEDLIRDNFRKMQSVGMAGRLISGDAIKQRLKSPQYQYAIEFPGLPFVHPGKMLKGILELNLVAGVQVYQNTPVLEVENSDSASETNLLKTPRGVVTAKKVLFATNAYTPRLNGMFSSRMIPIVLATVATRPLSEDEIRKFGVSFEAFIESQLVSRSFGFTPDRRIFMRGILGYAAFNSCWWGVDPAARERLKAELLERLPWLKGVEIPEYWEGAVAKNLSGFPMSGPLESPGQYISACFGGNGVVDGFYTGRLVAHQMAGAPHSDLGYLRSPYDTTAIIPHEPHRTIGAKTFFYFAT